MGIKGNSRKWLMLLERRDGKGGGRFEEMGQLKAPKGNKWKALILLQGLECGDTTK